MQEAGLGLSEVPTRDLKKLLKALHRNEIPFPFQKSNLLSMGMNRLAENGGAFLSGLDERSLRTVLTCVIAERLSNKDPDR